MDTDGVGNGAIIGTVVAALTAERLSGDPTSLRASPLAACGFLRRPWHGGFLHRRGRGQLTTASFPGWLPSTFRALPDAVVATGQGFAFSSGRVLAAAGAGKWQLLNAFGETTRSCARVISLIYVLGLLVIWFCPETKGKPLPE